MLQKNLIVWNTIFDKSLLGVRCIILLLQSLKQIFQDCRMCFRSFSDMDMIIRTDYSILFPQHTARVNRLDFIENVFRHSIRGCLPTENGTKSLSINAEINIKFTLFLDYFFCGKCRCNLCSSVCTLLMQEISCLRGM